MKQLLKFVTLETFQFSTPKEVNEPHPLKQSLKSVTLEDMSGNRSIVSPLQPLKQLLKFVTLEISHALILNEVNPEQPLKQLLKLVTFETFHITTSNEVNE